eukprot:CAMPEP_0170594576 /NCGR_PEP_ID=MMETSP0224-20130122/14076_1 /TAXON_ID=285029 /ORGANISM="Togula jolla, Strain CCCM 725" /LENGTH=137 /DNA_ID=CAMNT_0010918647 /DNA_START=56 /DNA_END=469 /DNA_ORIENTATION=-
MAFFRFALATVFASAALGQPTLDMLEEICAGTSTEAECTPLKCCDWNTTALQCEAVANCELPMRTVIPSVGDAELASARELCSEFVLKVTCQETKCCSWSPEGGECLPDEDCMAWQQKTASQTDDEEENEEDVEEDL